ncbi:hypothetical protein DCAR_0623183 [Daucus carota subsp. sativus]|uniref:DNA-directed RNA polymerase n=1 Tax=Daucus carota subsp. sativus TaxID=79200 RepID=A0AAF0X984_DAUCS|nr:hypothetical protein DCAR_0623183 [Daucus carota subsp. sativus]
MGRSSYMDIDIDDPFEDDLGDLGEPFLNSVCKKAATSFFQQHGLISHQLNSYNDFIKYGIQNVFDSIGEITVQPGYDPSKKGDSHWRYASFKFGKVKLAPPTFFTGKKFYDDNGIDFVDFYPRHARLQNMTYSSKMKVEVHLQVYTQRMVRSDKFKTGKEQYVDKTVCKEIREEIPIGTLPVMVKSDLCWMKKAKQGDCDFDQGGYFIIKGAEKTFVAQEQICLKRLWVTSSPWKASYLHATKRKRVKVHLLDPKSDDIGGVENFLTVSFLGIEIPIWVLFFALGVSSDKEVVDLIDVDLEDGRIINIMIASIHHADKDCDEECGEKFCRRAIALKYLEKKLKNCTFPPEESVEDCIKKYLFSSLTGFKQKARVLAYMTKCLLQAYTGRRKVDNRDDFRNKRLELAGELLERELKVHLKHAERRMVQTMQRDLYNDKVEFIERYLDSSIITNGLSRAFSTGAWSHPYKRGERTSGVVANLGRTNPLQMIAEMRRTRQHVDYTGRIGDARYPHPSHWGKLCFLSTPDGENCGLIKNLTSTGLVSTNVYDSILDKLLNCGMDELVDDTSSSLRGKDNIFLDGELVGTCTDPALFVEIKRDEKNREVRIFCDAGRILRPLFVVSNLRKIKSFKGGDYSFQSLLDAGVIELIGTEEEEDCCTAWGFKNLLKQSSGDAPKKYTHCELDMSFLLGLSAGLTPFCNHDHARRALYQSQKHSHQAIGFSTTNSSIRVDTSTNQLYYPQRPLFRTMLSECLGKSENSKMLPKPEFYHGQCAIVAVNVHLGYNQEDSLVMNRSSLERGMFRSEHVRSYKADVNNNEATLKKQKVEDAINFGKIPSKIGRVDSLDEDGFPFIGANLQTGDIVIGKHAESGVDQRFKLKHTEKGMVQKVILSSNDEGKNFAVVSLRQVRSPCLGDKFSSMHGQKRVLGFLESQENFPFTSQGIVPDIVINPHAFPSRQTPGQLLEAALGKGIALGGKEIYATPFSTASVDAIANQLHRAGFSRWGNERVYNGRTGEMVKFRNTGPVHPLTRQPVADRKRFGGIKFGEMERDCLMAHGASANLHDRLFTLSDCSQMHICRRCKHPANVILRPVTGGRKIRGPYCRYCQSAESIVKVSVPYGAKLLSQELFSMGISLKFETQLC